MPTFPSFEWGLELIFGNITIILPVLAVAFFLYTYFKFGVRSRLKPINRGEIERMSFIKRMKVNQNESKHFKNFRRGNKLIGKITHFAALKLATNPHPTEVIQMLVKPFAIPHLKLSNPFSKTLCVQINKEHTTQDLVKRELKIGGDIYLDYYFGIYYDKQSEEINTAFIKNDQLMRTDLDNLASIYFAKSQEQATFDPEKAHKLALEEKRIQVEQAKRSGKLTQI